MLLLEAVVPSDTGLSLEALGELVDGGASTMLSQQLLEETDG